MFIPVAEVLKQLLRIIKRKKLFILSLIQTNALLSITAEDICKDCHKSFQEDNPFTDSRSKVSNATIMQVLKDLKRCNYTFTSVAEKNNISASTVINIFDQFVDMQPGHLPAVLSIDEFYLDGTFDDKFACVFINWETGRIIDIYPSRRKYKLYSYTQYMNKDEFSDVKYVSIDMNKTYKDYALHFFKNVLLW